MSRLHLRRPSPAMLVALAALFFAMSGTAFAAVATLKPGEVTTKTIKDGAVTNSKLANGAVTTSKLKDRSVTVNQLHSGSVTTSNLINGAVNTPKLRNHAVTGKKVASNTLTGHNIDESTLGTVPRAETAATATSAAPIAYAHVNADGTVDATNSSNVTSSNVSRTEISSDCFHDLPFTVHGAVITIDYGTVLANFAAGAKNSVATVALGDPGNDCTGVSNTELVTLTAVDGAFAPAGFFIVFY